MIDNIFVYFVFFYCLKLSIIRGLCTGAGLVCAKPRSYRKVVNFIEIWINLLPTVFVWPCLVLKWCRTSLVVRRVSPNVGCLNVKP